MISAKRVLTRLRLRRVVLAVSLVVLVAAASPTAASAVTPGPAWAISALTSPTRFTPEDNSGLNVYVIQVTNVGSKDTNGGPVTISDFLPPGLTLNPNPGIFGYSFEAYEAGTIYPPCEAGPPARCTLPPMVFHPGQKATMEVPVNVEPGASATVTNHVTVSGGGAVGASTDLQTTIDSGATPFGFQALESSLLGVDGNPETRAGSHPYQFRIAAQFNTHRNSVLAAPPAENPLDINADLPAGLIVNPHATTALCTEVQFETRTCPDAAAVGLAHSLISELGPVKASFSEPVYNLVPPPGAPAAFGFDPAGFGIFIHLLGHIRSDGDYGISSDTADIPQYGQISGVAIDLWGNPSDPSHDHRRGECGYPFGQEFGLTCPTASSEIPLLTMPSACSGPLVTSMVADSWQHRGAFVSRSAQTEDAAGNPVGVTGCDKLTYAPATETIMSTEQAESGSGLDFNVDFPDNGLDKHNALAESNTEKAVVTLPEGVTIDPSVGEGLGFCTPAQYAKEQIFTGEGEGCPSDSKLGTLHLTTPLVDEAIDGSVYLAQQDNPETTEHGAENPFDTDIALYFVLRNTQLGVMVKQPLKVEPDPKTGQLVATLENIPQLPFSHFTFHFKEGARAALVTPPHCGAYTTVSKFYPYSDPTNPKVVESSFEITKGVNGGACPPGGVPPFHPEFQAGSVNNAAGSFSPFNMRLLRRDGEQDMTKFSAILPPGELGSLAGVSKCPDSAIVVAKSKTGRQEKASPSCPANSLIGHTLAGAGVGDSLTYVPGNLYLGGPYHGDPLSVIAITPALAGPFDAGTVVVQEALTLNPKTAEVQVDGAASDPIPHILKGIPLKLRELRVYVDRQNFTLNPTSCAVSHARSTLFGSNLNVFDPADDDPVNLQTRFQAADCQSLGFKPHLSLNLVGGTRRGAHPALKATYRARPGDANTEGVVVRLPHSAFLDQAHIRTICTRVQFAAKACPAGARYGFVRAFTPLLDEPLEGPVYLRSSNHKLPDMVFDLHGLVDVEVVTRIDSSHGGIRATVEEAPDAPLTKVILNMQGAKKGLIVNSKNICTGTNRANVLATGHNGKQSASKPVLRAKCGKARHKKHRRHRG